MEIDSSQTINRFAYLDAYPLPRIDDQINEIAKCEIYSTLDLKSAYYQIRLAKSDRVLLRREQSKSKPEYTQNPEHLQRDRPGTN